MLKWLFILSTLLQEGHLHPDLQLQSFLRGFDYRQPDTVSGHADPPDSGPSKERYYIPQLSLIRDGEAGGRWKRQLEGQLPQMTTWPFFPREKRCRGNNRNLQMRDRLRIKPKKLTHKNEVELVGGIRTKNKMATHQFEKMVKAEKSSEIEDYDDYDIPYAYQLLQDSNEAAENVDSGVPGLSAPNPMNLPSPLAINSPLHQASGNLLTDYIFNLHSQRQQARSALQSRLNNYYNQQAANLQKLLDLAGSKEYQGHVSTLVSSLQTPYLGKLDNNQKTNYNNNPAYFAPNLKINQQQNSQFALNKQGVPALGTVGSALTYYPTQVQGSQTQLTNLNGKTTPHQIDFIQQQQLQAVQNMGVNGMITNVLAPELGSKMVPLVDNSIGSLQDEPLLIPMGITIQKPIVWGKDLEEKMANRASSYSGAQGTELKPQGATIEDSWLPGSSGSTLNHPSKIQEYQATIVSGATQGGNSKERSQPQPVSNYLNSNGQDVSKSQDKLERAPINGDFVQEWKDKPHPMPIDLNMQELSGSGNKQKSNSEANTLTNVQLFGNLPRPPVVAEEKGYHPQTIHEVSTSIGLSDGKGTPDLKTMGVNQEGMLQPGDRNTEYLLKQTQWAPISVGNSFNVETPDFSTQDQASIGIKPGRSSVVSYPNLRGSALQGYNNNPQDQMKATQKFPATSEILAYRPQPIEETRTATSDHKLLKSWNIEDQQQSLINSNLDQYDQDPSSSKTGQVNLQRADEPDFGLNVPNQMQNMKDMPNSNSSSSIVQQYPAVTNGFNRESSSPDKITHLNDEILIPTINDNDSSLFLQAHSDPLSISSLNENPDQLKMNPPDSLPAESTLYSTDNFPKEQYQRLLETPLTTANEATFTIQHPQLSKEYEQYAGRPESQLQQQTKVGNFSYNIDNAVSMNNKDVHETLEKLKQIGRVSNEPKKFFDERGAAVKKGKENTTGLHTSQQFSVNEHIPPVSLSQILQTTQLGSDSPLSNKTANQARPSIAYLLRPDLQSQAESISSSAQNEKGENLRNENSYIMTIPRKQLSKFPQAADRNREDESVKETFVKEPTTHPLLKNNKPLRASEVLAQPLVQLMPQIMPQDVIHFTDQKSASEPLPPIKDTSSVLLRQPWSADPEQTKSPEDMTKSFAEAYHNEKNSVASLLQQPGSQAVGLKFNQGISGVPYSGSGKEGPSGGVNFVREPDIDVLNIVYEKDGPEAASGFQEIPISGTGSRPVNISSHGSKGLLKDLNKVMFTTDLPRQPTVGDVKPISDSFILNTDDQSSGSRIYIKKPILGAFYKSTQQGEPTAYYEINRLAALPDVNQKGADYLPFQRGKEFHSLTAKNMKNRTEDKFSFNGGLDPEQLENGSQNSGALQGEEQGLQFPVGEKQISGGSELNIQENVPDGFLSSEGTLKGATGNHSTKKITHPAAQYTSEQLERKIQAGYSQLEKEQSTISNNPYYNNNLDVGKIEGNMADFIAHDQQIIPEKKMFEGAVVQPSEVNDRPFKQNPLALPNDMPNAKQFASDTEQLELDTFRPNPTISKVQQVTKTSPISVTMKTGENGKVVPAESFASYPNPILPDVVFPPPRQQNQNSGNIQLENRERLQEVKDETTDVSPQLITKSSSAFTSPGRSSPIYSDLQSLPGSDRSLVPGRKYKTVVSVPKISQPLKNNNQDFVFPSETVIPSGNGNTGTDFLPDPHHQIPGIEPAVKRKLLIRPDNVKKVVSFGETGSDRQDNMNQDTSSAASLADFGHSENVAIKSGGPLPEAMANLNIVNRNEDPDQRKPKSSDSSYPHLEHPKLSKEENIYHPIHINVTPVKPFQFNNLKHSQQPAINDPLQKSQLPNSNLLSLIEATSKPFDHNSTIISPENMAYKPSNQIQLEDLPIHVQQMGEPNTAVLNEVQGLGETGNKSKLGGSPENRRPTEIIATYVPDAPQKEIMAGSVTQGYQQSQSIEKSFIQGQYLNPDYITPDAEEINDERYLNLAKSAEEATKSPEDYDSQESEEEEEDSEEPEDDNVFRWVSPEYKLGTKSEGKTENDSVKALFAENLKSARQRFYDKTQVQPVAESFESDEYEDFTRSENTVSIPGTKISPNTAEITPKSNSHSIENHQQIVFTTTRKPLSNKDILKGAQHKHPATFNLSEKLKSFESRAKAFLETRKQTMNKFKEEFAKELKSPQTLKNKISEVRDTSLNKKIRNNLEVQSGPLTESIMINTRTNAISEVAASPTLLQLKDEMNSPKQLNLLEDKPNGSLNNLVKSDRQNSEYKKESIEPAAAKNECSCRIKNELLGDPKIKENQPSEKSYDVNNSQENVQVSSRHNEPTCGCRKEIKSSPLAQSLDQVKAKKVKTCSCGHGDELGCSNSDQFVGALADKNEGLTKYNILSNFLLWLKEDARNPK